jgi:hypothetical protein
MAHAGPRYYTGDRNIVAAARAYCAETAALTRLCELYDDLPDRQAEALFSRMTAAKQRALRHPSTTMAGVIAKARMVAAGELFDVDPLVVSAIEDLLAVYPAPRISRWTCARPPVKVMLCGVTVS